MKRTPTLRFVSAFLILALSACASPPGPPPPQLVTATFSASPDANPDFEGRASPVLVKVLTLAADGKFAKADFFDVFENPAAALGADLIDVAETTVLPGAEVKLDLSTTQEAAFIGVVAGYREIDSASWRDVVPIDALGEDLKLVVKLDKGVASIERSSE